MKKAKIVAAVVLAAAVGTTTLVAACGSDKDVKGKEFNISDYAHALDSEYAKGERYDYSSQVNANDAYTKLTKKNYKHVETFSNTNYVKVTVKHEDSADTYTLYDVKGDKELVTGCSSISNKSVNGYYNFQCFIIGKNNNDKTEFQLVGPDGSIYNKKLTSEEIGTIDFERVNSYYDEDKNLLEFFKMTYKDYDDEGEFKDVEVYFCYSKDTDGVVSFKEVKEEDTEEPASSDYAAGTQLGLIKIDLGNSDYFPGNNLEGYKATVEGIYSKTYTLYKDSTTVGSFTIENGEAVGWAGNYVYYYEVEAVDADATSGYNYEEVSQYGAVKKANYTYYRLDFVNNGEPEEVKTNYIITDLGTALYNYSTKTYDKIYVSKAYKKVNGVVVVNDTSKIYSLVLDDEFHVSADLSGKNIGNPSNVYKLKDNRYLSGNCILDGELNTVTQLESYGYVWEDQKLVVGTVEDDYGRDNTIFVDYDGKVVIEPSYGQLSVYGDVAYSSNGKFYSAKNPSGIKLDKLVKADKTKGETVSRRAGYILKYTPVEKEVTIDSYTQTVTSYTVTFYDYTGKQLGSIGNIEKYGWNDAEISFDSVGGKVIVTVTVYKDLTKNLDTETNYWVLG